MNGAIVFFEGKYPPTTERNPLPVKGRYVARRWMRTITLRIVKHENVEVWVSYMINAAFDQTNSLQKGLGNQ